MENKLIGNDNNEFNIYAMLHDFRNWNRDWDVYMSQNQLDADDFVKHLAKKWIVNPSK